MPPEKAAWQAESLLYAVWPKWLVGSGLALFWAACIWSDRLPDEAFVVGPAMMLAGAILMGLNVKREQS